MLKGIYAPIPTPFDQSGDITFRDLKNNINFWGQTSIRGLVVSGTNGEAVLLDHDEKIKLFSFTREHLPAEKTIIAGTGCESARATVKLTNETAASGIDAALVITPSYFKGAMTDDLLYNYYMHVAENSIIPVVLYNMPRNSGVNISASLACRLSGHSNIIGIKDSSGDIAQIQATINGCSEDFAVSAGSAGFLLPSMVMGAVGGTAALANIMPEECVRIITLFEAGELEEARKLQLKLLEINAAVTSRWGVSGLKAALDMLGYYGGPPRLPLLPLSKENEKLLHGILKKSGCKIVSA